MVQFSNVPVVGQAGYIEVNTGFQNDISPLKVDLIYGTFRSEDGSQYLLPVVKKAENTVVNETLSHNYLSPTEIENFSKAACSLLLGDIEKLWKEGLIFGAQSIGGAGALKIGAEFLSRYMNCTTVYYPDPIWEMHGTMFSFSGFQNKFQYRYINRETKGIDFEGLCKDISNAAIDSVIILHACSHNPIGLDPTKEQWRTIAKIMKKRELIPFFDIAYQGMASGGGGILKKMPGSFIISIVKESNFYVHNHFPRCLLYERVGNLMIVQKSGHKINSLKVHFKRIIRSLYSNPPNHGARTVLQILSNPELYDKWSISFKALIERSMEIRKAFEGALKKWKHVTDQKEMFILLHLTNSQVEYLRNFHHIYMIDGGRINVTGLNFTNIRYIAKAINDTLRKNL